MLLVISSILASGIKAANNIECTPLQGGDYASCNANCYPGNTDCYYGSGAATPGQRCYCYIESPPQQANTIECTPLEGGNYAECNAKCSKENPLCYYGVGAAEPGQLCYCFTENKRRLLNDIECTPLEGGNYDECNANCYFGNSDCYYGTNAAAPGQHCYCWTDMIPLKPVKPIGGDKDEHGCLIAAGYTWCDIKQKCLKIFEEACTSKPVKPIPTQNKKAIECTPLEGGDYTQCNDKCYFGHPDCYYGSGAANVGQHCYCWTDMLPPKPIPTQNKKSVECTPLEGGDYTECNDKCHIGHSDCYYGTGAASPGQHCYCWTDKLHLNPIGGDKDEHGCFLSAGYTWCDSKQKCLQLFEEVCPTENIKSIECTPLEGGDYTECNDKCYFGHSDCYYGSGAANPGQHCYCYTSGIKGKRRLIDRLL